jgi:hypothetical protein
MSMDSTPPPVEVMPTPQDVLPLAECAVPYLADALRLGIGFADDLQVNAKKRDPWFWSHSARGRACEYLLGLGKVEREGWGITKGPNTGIHLRLDDIHTARVLRSLNDTVPHPGPNHARRMVWMQGTLPPNDGSLPSLSLLMDWRVKDDEPYIYISLPIRPWRYGATPQVYWRVPVTGDAGRDLANLQFDPGLLPGEQMVSFKVDPAERNLG